MSDTPEPGPKTGPDADTGPAVAPPPPGAATAEATPAESAPAEAATGTPFDRRMLEALVCPLTLTTLHYDADRQELVSRAASLAFPIRDGIPIMLPGEARALE